MTGSSGAWTGAALATIALFALASCGDNLAAVDAGLVAITDARRSQDSAPRLCGDAAHCADEPFAGRCAGGRCVECVNAADCDVLAGALGPSCDPTTGYCTCSDNAQCASSPLGPICHPVTSSCSCITPRDCPDGVDCAIEPYLGSGVRTCRPGG